MTRTSSVDELLDELIATWNAGDATAYADLFVDDADYITFFGQNMAGRPAIEAGHKALFEGPLKGARLTSGGTTPKIRFLRPDVAVIVTTGGAPGDDTQRSIITLTAVRNQDQWRFAAFQNTRVMPFPGTPS